MTQYIMAVSSWLSISSILDAIKDLKRTYQRRADARVTYKELSKLSDRELKDIGISRSDILSIAQNTFHRNENTNKNLKGWV